MSDEQKDGKVLAGLAALSICESLLLALLDRKVLGEDEIRGVLEDAAMAHRDGVGNPQWRADDAAVARIIDKLRAGLNLTQN